MRCCLSIFCLSFALFASGCATTRTQAPPSEVPEQTLSSDAIQTLEDSTACTPDEAPHQQIYRLLRRSFVNLQTRHRNDAVPPLDSAAVALADLFAAGEDSLSPQRLAGLVRVSLELYRDVLPQTVPIPLDSPLAYLLDALPESTVAQIEGHAYYREFHVRKLAAAADVPIDYTPEVIESLHFFQTAGREIFVRWLARAGADVPMIQRILREADMPEDLAYMAMIESGFNPRAYSRARAVGLWQFTGHTGRLYGLRRNTWLDERRDPEKATRAAARHSRDLYDIFGDWRLVVAAYNCGHGRLNRSIRKSGTRDFWKITSLPRETRKHVPRFMAAVLIARDPEWFGFGDVAYENPLAYEVVSVSECIDLRVAAECAGTSYERMRALNPELRLGYTPPPPVHRSYRLRIPSGTADRFRARYARIPEGRKVQMVDYTVRSGDTVSDIARGLRVSTQAVLDANGIRNPRRLRAGTSLKIPLRPEQYARARKLAEAQVKAPPDLSRHTRASYTVRRGDTLWEIARREGVTPEQIRSWNGLSASQHIYPGNRLVLWKPRDLPAPNVESREGGETSDVGFYTVKPGDTLWEIARAFQTSVKDLKRWNGIRRASRLRAGSRIIIRPANDAPGTVE